MEERSARVMVMTWTTVTFPSSLLAILIAYFKANFESGEKSIGTRILTMR
jgi:hypothetical protein